MLGPLLLVLPCLAAECLTLRPCNASVLEAKAGGLAYASPAHAAADGRPRLSSGSVPTSPHLMVSGRPGAFPEDSGVLGWRPLCACQTADREKRGSQMGTQTLLCVSCCSSRSSSARHCMLSLLSLSCQTRFDLPRSLRLRRSFPKPARAGTLLPSDRKSVV